MSEKHLVCKGATVYCSKSIINNNPASAIPLNITSQNTVVINDGKVVATEKDCTSLNMNFGMCNNGSIPPPCTANVQWSNLYEGATVTDAGLKLLIEASKGICTCGGGQIKIAYHGQIATPQIEEVKSIVPELIWGIMPVSFEKKDLVPIEITPPESLASRWRRWREKRRNNKKAEEPKSSDISKKGVSIKIMDNDKPLKEDFIQVVNLPSGMFDNIPAKFRFIDKESQIPLEKHQLGRKINYQIIFKNRIKGDFKLYLVTNSDNVTYTNTEQQRNDKFKYQIPNHLSTTSELNSNKILLKNIFYNPKAGTKIDGEFCLTLAGGNKYQLIVERDNEVVANSVRITTWRMFFFVDVKMTNSSSTIDDFSVFISEYEKHFVIIKSLGTDFIQRMCKIEYDIEYPLLINSLNNICSNYVQQSPYFAVIAQVENMTDRKKIRLEFEITAGERTIEVLLKTDRIYPLWMDIEGVEEKYWLRSIFFHEWNEKGEWKEIQEIPKYKITPLKKDYEGYFYIEFALQTPYPRNLAVFLSIDVVESIKTGFSAGDYNLVGIATKVLGRPVDFNTMMQTIIHEIGHQIGLVPCGPDFDYDNQPVVNYTSLDRPLKTYYGNNARGHIGPHCNYGEDDDTQRVCVMFGANHARKTSVFCDVCATCIKKVDIISNI